MKSGAAKKITGEKYTEAFPSWVVIVSAIIALSAAVPHAWQVATCPQDKVFTGFVEAHNDQNIYMMWSRQARAGRVLMNNYATAEQAPPIFVGPHWVAFGTLARLIPIPLIVLYRILAVVLAFVYLLILWRLMCEVFPDDDPRLFGFVIGALGSGFGAVCDAINSAVGRDVVFSTDAMPELWAYHSFHLPHFTLALCGIALLALFVIRACRAPSLRLYVAATAAGFFTIAVHPYDVVVLAPLLVLHAVVVLLMGGHRRQIMAHLSGLVGMGVPAVFYALQARTDPLIAIWAKQNVLRSPPPLQYLIGLGVTLPLAIIGYRAMDRHKHSAVAHLMALWIAVTAIAVYSYPLVPFERRAVEGLHIPLAILAGAALARRVVPWLEKRMQGGRFSAKRAAMTLLLVAILPTNIKLMLHGMRTDAGCIARAQLDAFEWTEANTPPEARIFCDRSIGVLCVRYALRHAHSAHSHVTVDPDRKNRMAEDFFAPETDDTRRREILHEAGCGWVVADGSQVEVTAGLPWLEEVFSANSTAVYRFADSPPPPKLRPA